MATLDGGEDESIGNIVGFDLEAGTVVLKPIDCRDLIRKAFANGTGSVILVTPETDWKLRAQTAEHIQSKLEARLKEAQEEASLAVRELAWVRENGR